MSIRRRVRKLRGIVGPPATEGPTYREEVESWRAYQREACKELSAPPEVAALVDAAADALLDLGPEPLDLHERDTFDAAGARRAERLVGRRTSAIPHPGPHIPEAVEVAAWTSRMWFGPREGERARAQSRRLERMGLLRVPDAGGGGASE